MRTLRLRPATLDDVEVLEGWDEDPAVRDPALVGGWWDWSVELAEGAPWVERLIAEDDGRAIGFVQLLDTAGEPSGYWGDDAAPGVWAIDLWIGDVADRGRGYGKRIMHLALDRCVTVHGATAVLVDPLASNIDAHRFYRACGLGLMGERVLDGDRCLVHRWTRISD